MTLCVIYLCAFYVLKFFIPDQLVLSIENERLILIGNYIDSHLWVKYLFGTLTSFVIYWLYLCAVCKRWYLNIVQSIIVLIIIGLSNVFSQIDANLYSALSYTSFIILPLLFGAKLKEVAIVYTVHIFSQTLTLSIRNLPIYMTNINVLTIFIVGIESYIWLILFYIYYNYKEKRLWDGCSRLSTEKEQAELKETSKESTEKSSNSTQRLTFCERIRLFIKRNFARQTIKKRLHKLKLVILDFIVGELWIYAIIIGAISLVSWLFNRWVQGLMLCIAHIAIRRVFDKQYHCNTTAGCLSLTLGIIWFSIPITLPIVTSLLSSIPIAFLICFFGFVAQDRVDLIVAVKKLQNHVNELMQKLSHKDIYAMTEQELYEHCRNCGLSEEDCQIAKLVVIDRLKGQELYRAMGYSERNSKRKRKYILETIK